MAASPRPVAELIGERNKPKAERLPTTSAISAVAAIVHARPDRAGGRSASDPPPEVAGEDKEAHARRLDTGVDVDQAEAALLALQAEIAQRRITGLVPVEDRSRRGCERASISAQNRSPRTSAPISGRVSMTLAQRPMVKADNCR